MENTSSKLVMCVSSFFIIDSSWKENFDFLYDKEQGGHVVMTFLMKGLLLPNITWLLCKLKPDNVLVINSVKNYCLFGKSQVTILRWKLNSNDKQIKYMTANTSWPRNLMPLVIAICASKYYKCDTYLTSMQE